DGRRLEGYAELVDIRIALFLLATVPVATGPSLSTVEAFEQAATLSQKFLDLGCVLYDRLDRDRDCGDEAGAELVRGDYPIPDLEGLTKHRHPRVRTLALVCLFAKGDPKLLPLIFTLVDDRGPTFPARTPIAYIPSTPRPTAFSEIPQTPQTVGSVAEGMMEFYLRRAGYSYGSHGKDVCPGF